MSWFYTRPRRVFAVKLANGRWSVTNVDGAVVQMSDEEFREQFVVDLPTAPPAPGA